MKTLVIEDQDYIRKGLLRMLSSVEMNIDVIGECSFVEEAIQVAHAHRPELVLLDVNLADGSGFDFLERTEQLTYKVIFITSYQEHALQALKIGAVDYLLKPIDSSELEVALQKVEQLSISSYRERLSAAKTAWNGGGGKLILSMQDNFQVLDLSEVLFCQSDKGYTTFHLCTGKKHVASKSLKEFEFQLLLNGFARPHKSFMVNLTYADRYDKSGVIHLKNGNKIPVSMRRRESFLGTFLNWNR